MAARAFAVSELVAALKPALLAQYELDASVSGSGYSARVQSQAAIAAAAATAAAAAAAAAAEDESSVSGGPKLRRPASGSNDEGDGGVIAGSSEEEGRHNLRVHGATSRRNSAPSVAPHSTPSVAPRPSHALLTSPSPLFFPSTAAQHGAAAVEAEAPLVVPDPTAIDLVTSEHATARLLWAWETQLEHEYRLFALLEHSLKKPYLLSVHYCVLQLSFQMSLQLTNMYYDFDKAFMRQLMGQKLSTKTRGNIHDMQNKMADERNAEEVERRRRANLDYPPQPTPQQQHRARRNSQSVASLSTLLGSGGGGGVIGGSSGVSALSSYPLGSAHCDGDLASTLTSNEDEGPSVLDPSAPSVAEVRFSSCCRQFDNLRRIYRCRWGEKGDGVVDETDLRMDDWDAGTSLLHSTIRAGAASAELQSLSAAGMAPVGSARARELMLGERWRAMRAAAIAAMAKRGFGSDKAAATTAATSSTANAAADAAALKAQQWMLRHFDGSGGAGGSNAGVALGGGLDSFFGLDMSTQAMRLADQTAPVFYQQQFRLHSSLARSYSRLIFLAHYRIGVSLAIKRKKKQFDMLSFDEVQLLAQILMRCWAVPVGSAAGDESLLDEPLLGRQDSSRAPVDPSPFSVSTTTGAPPSNPAMATGGNSSAFFPQSISPNLRPAVGPAASLATLPSDSTVGALASTSNANMFAGPTAVSRMVTAESTSRAALRRLSVDEPTGAPSLYILSPASLDDSTLRSSSLSSPRSASGAACAGYDFLPIVAQMRAADEDVWVGDALDADFINGLAELKSQMGSKLLDEYAVAIGKMFRDTIQLHAAAGAAASPLAAAAAAPVGGSASTAGASAASGAGAPVSSSLRPSVLAKLLSRLPALLKSLHSLSVSLHKSKRLRTLLSDLIEDVLRPLLKQGAAAPAPLELMFLMRCVRDAVTTLPSLSHLGIERSPVYPHPYERRQRQQAAAQDAMRRQHSVSSMQATPSHAGALSTIAHAGSVSGGQTGGPTAADPLHRAILHWCRFLDAVGPICVILYMKLSHATQDVI